MIIMLLIKPSQGKGYVHQVESDKLITETWLEEYIG